MFKSISLSFKTVFVLSVVAVFCAFSAKAQPTACLTKAQAEAIPVTWTDASGVQHTNTLADRATDPRHIIALLKEAYTNKNVPGIWQAAYTNDGVREDDVYYGAVRYNNGQTVTGWNITGTGNTVYKPNEEGYTLFIVAVKDSYSGGTIANYNNLTPAQLITYFNNAVEYVELVPGGWRVNDTDNPGMMFTLSGEFSRFFFLSKGKARKNNNSGNVTVENGAQPFYRMFEEFSPYNSQSSTEDITDFYAKLVAGETFPVEHDCVSVIGRGHYFSMAGKNATAKYDVTGLNMLIPDYRLKYFRRTGGGPTDGRSDGTSTGSTVNATFVNYNPDYAPEMFMYAIKLQGNAQQLSEENHTYTVTLDWSTTYSPSESQTFAVYAVVDGVVQDTPLVDGLHNIYQWSTTVEQDTHGYTLTYVVRGKPDDAGFGVVTSNQVSVIIPGYDPQERLKLTISGSFESEYKIADQRNQYANYIIMNNGEGTSVTREYLAANSTFELHRYEEGATTPEDADKVVATMKITNVTTNRCSYEVTYANQDGAVEGKYPAKTGTFTIKSDGNLDFANFMMCDQFSASTENNDHKNHYTYQIRFESEKEFLDLDGHPTHEVYSNVTNVNVYKVEYELAGESYTKEQVDGDINAAELVPVKGEVAMSFVALNDRNVLEYNMMSTDSETRRAYAQNNNDGTYTVHNSDESSSVMSNNEVVVTDNISGANAGMLGYVPVIETYRNDGSGNRNTYGADVKKTPSMKVSVNENNKMMSEDTFVDSEGKTCRYYKVCLNGDVALPEGFEIYKIRVWRNSGNVVREVQTRYMDRLDQNVAIVDTDNGGSKNINFNDDYAMTFGALDVKTNGAFTSTFTVRLYTRAIEPVTNAGMPRFAPAESNYFITERTLDVVFDDNVITGVSGVTAEANVQSVRYYDAMGHVSSKPFAGINVVVKTMSDGSHQTTKVLY